MTLKDKIAEVNPEALILDGLDEAIIGMVERPNLGPVVGYSVKKIIDILMERDGMSYDGAYEFYSFNINCAYMGKFTPVYIDELIKE